MIAGLMLSILTALPLQGAPEKSAPDGNRLVQVTLAADHAALRPGETCTLAVKLSIEPKWHIYWQNPGDAGVPTRVEVRAPSGFEIGRVQYPPPEREESEGDILSYVYRGEVVLLVDVKAPASLTPGTKIELGVSCIWLVCTTLCVAGRGEAQVELAAAAESRLAHATEFAAWRAKMPRPYEDLLAIAGFHAGEFVDWNKPWVLEVPGALALDFYPYVEDPITLNVSDLQLERAGDGCTMKLSFEPPAGYAGPRFGFSGLLVVQRAKGRAYYHVGFGYGSQGAGGVPAKNG
jgi:DsbC/DsbD-like thiol-disulfide interchange protein